MTTEEKLDLIIACLADMYLVVAALAPKVGYDLTPPDALRTWQQAQEGKAHG